MGVSIVSKRTRTLALVGIVTLGLALRLWGLDFGLPYRYHIDETQIIPPAARLCAGDYNMPPNYAGPNLQHMVLGAGDLALYGIGLATGRWHSPTDFATAYEADPTAVFLVARLIHALLGTATIAVVYWLGRALWHDVVGLVAAVILGFTYFHVRESHFSSRDLFASVPLAVSLLFSARLLRTRSPKDGALSGLFSGLAAGVMWTVGLGFLPTMVAHLLSFRTSAGGPGLRSRASLKAASITILAAGGGFLLAYPNLILRPAVALDYFNILVRYADEGEVGCFLFSSSPGWLYYLRTLWWGAGPLLVLVFLGGMVLAIVRHTPEDMTLLAFMVPYFIVIGGTANYLGRYLTPMIALAAVLGARFLVSASTWIGVRFPGQRRILVIATLLAVAPSLVSSVRFDYLLTQTDTRTLAKEWIEQHVPEGTKIAVDWPIHGPPLSSVEDPQPDSAKMYQVLVVGGVGLAGLDIADYRQQSVDLLVASSNISNIRLRDQNGDAARQEFYRSLDENLGMLAAFKPYVGGTAPPFVFDEIYGPAISLWQRERPGPTIKVYKAQ